MIRRLLWVVAVIGVTGVSCDSGPKAGELAFRLETPQNDDRAIIFKATAKAPFMITGITADCAGCQVFVEKVSDIDWRGVLTGIPGNGPAIRLAVSDRKEVEAYAAVVTRVSGADYRLRSTLNRRLVHAK